MSDLLRLGGHIAVYLGSWLIIYVRNRDDINRHKLFTLVLAVVFLIFSLLLAGFVWVDFREMWISAFSWPIVVSYILLAYSKRERRTMAYRAVIEFLEKKKRFYEEVLNNPNSEQFERQMARLRTRALNYTLDEIRGIIDV